MIGLVDPYGKPVRSLPRARARRTQALDFQAGVGWGLYQTPRSAGEGDFYRPRTWGLTDLQSAFNGYEWAELVEFSRQLFSQLANLGYAVLQKNLYAVGDAWIPQYLGRDKKWGEAAEEWLHHVWLPQCNLAGGVSDWQTDLFLSGVAWDVDGDDVALFVIDEGGFPKIAYRPAHQVGSSRGTEEVKGGPFDGAKICNGVIHDRAGRFLGVRVVHGRRESGEDQPFEDIPAMNCDFRYEPVWRSQHRGLPRLASALLDMMDVQDIKVFLKRGVKLESALGLIHTNEAGEAAPNSDIIDERTTSDDAEAQDIKIEKRLGGEVLYMRANAGEKLEGFEGKKPTTNSMEFLRGLERNGLLSLGWFYELIDPSKIGGASVRLIQDEARHSILSRQRTHKKRATRAVQFAIAQAMRTKRIPPNDDGGDFLKWGFGLPAQLTVDAGYDEQADRENLAIGTTTFDHVCQKKGRWWEDVRGQRLKENVDLVLKARELMATVNAQAEPEERLTLREAILLMQSSSNVEGLRAALDKSSQERPEPNE